MNGVHDMGGMDGFGKVEPEPNEPVFHARWEGRVVAMTRAMVALGHWNIDIGRYGIEVLPPSVYLSSSYYRRWFLRTANLLMQRGLVRADELAAGHSLRADDGKDKKKFSVADIERVSRRSSFARTASAPARFKLGERVRAINMHPKSHTRLPRYVRGHAGVVERIHGAHVFPDAFVAGKGEIPQWLYTVRFEARELWGPDADPTVKVSIEAFEPYLEHA
ncbi:MAG: nitrile hydratase subunit beta [Betaproteobacteria bacterium]